MAIYRIEMMTKSDYHEYITGGYKYWIRTFDIEANSANEAIEIAKSDNPEMIITSDCVLTIAELEKRAALLLAAIKEDEKAEETRKANAKARKAEREKIKAETLGLTIEEYRAKVEHDKEVRYTEKQIATLKAELTKAEEHLKKLKKEA